MKIGAASKAAAAVRRARFVGACTGLMVFSGSLMWISFQPLKLLWYDPTGRLWSLALQKPAPAAIDFYARFSVCALLGLIGGVAGQQLARRFSLPDRLLRATGIWALGITFLGMAWYDYSLLTRVLPPPPAAAQPSPSAQVTPVPMVATTPPPKSPSRIVVPRISNKIHLDGELEEPVWHASGRTGPFLFFHSREPARPYSDARFLRDQRFLYVGMYAADEDQRRGVDAFKLNFIDPRDGSTLAMSISVDKQLFEKRIKDGTETAWSSGVHFGVEADGTLDDPSDNDEEWVVEAAIPLASLGVTAGTRELKAMISRCDTPKGAPVPSCGAWGLGAENSVAGTLVLSTEIVIPGLPKAQDPD